MVIPMARETSLAIDLLMGRATDSQTNLVMLNCWGSDWERLTMRVTGYCLVKYSAKLMNSDSTTTKG